MFIQGVPKKGYQIQIQTSALFQTSYCSALKCSIDFELPMRKHTQFYTHGHKEKLHNYMTLHLRVVNNLAPSRFSSMFQNSNYIHSYNLRGSSSSLFLPRPNTEYGRKCFRYRRVKIWNSIPEQVRNSESLNSFDRNISCVSLTN